MPTVFRGASRRRALRSLGTLTLVYLTGFVALWVMGLVVRGWRGWLLVIGPLLILAASRWWSWRRVSVAVDDDAVRYEGSSPEHDLEVPLARLVAVHRDTDLPGAPLVLALDDGDERALLELGESAADALESALAERLSARRAPDAPRAPR